MAELRSTARKQPPLPPPYEVRAPTRRRPGCASILHVIANFYIGGSAQLVVDLVEGLGDRFEQRVIVRDLPPTPAYMNLDLHHYPEMSEELAADCLREFEPDLLHVHFLGHHGNPYSEHDWQWYDAVFRATGSGRPIVENLNIPVDPYVSPAVSRYVFVSDYVRNNFGDGVGPSVTIHPGSDLERFSRRNPTTQDPDPDVIGMAYRLQEDKLNEGSLDPFFAVVRQRPSTKALIVGGGPFYRDYTERVSAEGLADRFEFTGFVSYASLPALISRMSVFVAPVHWESFGQISVFAMGLGVPVVGYDVGGLPEILGGRELLAPPGDSAALSQLIIDVLEDDARRHEIGRANRKRALARFTVRTMIDRYERVYRELLGAR
jgi:glycosyltransferase involved in cell wall biosynthesis